MPIHVDGAELDEEPGRVALSNRSIRLARTVRQHENAGEFTLSGFSLGWRAAFHDNAGIGREARLFMYAA